MPTPIGTDGHVEAVVQGTAVTSALPTGFTFDGTQLCLMEVSFGSGASETTITTPSGWNKLEVSGLSTKNVVFWRFLQFGDAAPTFTLSTSRAWASHSTAFSDVDPTNPINQSSGLDFASASSYTSSTITPTVDGCTIIACWGGKTGTDPLRQTVTIPSPWTDTVGGTAPSPYTPNQSTIAAVNNNWSTFQYRQQTTAVAVSESVTVANGATAQCWIIALAPIASVAASAPQVEVIPPPVLIELLAWASQQWHVTSVDLGGTPETGALPVPIIGQGQQVKVAPQSGAASFAVTGQGQSAKVQAVGSRAVVVLVGTSRASKTQGQSGLLEAVIIGTGQAVRRAPETGGAVLAVVANGRAVKVAVEGGYEPVPVTGQRTLIIVPRAQTGALALALVGPGRAVKLQQVVAVSTTALVGQGREVHVAKETAIAIVGFVGSGTEVHKAVQTGRAVLSIIGTGAEVRKVALSGRTFFTVVGLGIELVPQAGTTIRIRIFGRESPGAAGVESSPAAGREPLAGTGGAEGRIYIFGLESPNVGGEEEGT